MSLIEGNKDEAYRCIEIAEQALIEGKLEKAEKFLQKAEKLYPTSRAKALLGQVRNFPNASKKRGRSETSCNTDGSQKRKNSDSRNVEPEYTAEQLESVQKIKKCKNYYEVLGITKEATDSEIKKAYKKLALQLHPDKNKAPGALEAFKALGNAAAILTDVEKRKSYDLYGINEPFNPHGGTNATPSSFSGMSRTYYTSDFGYSRGFQADVSAEEIFNMFFGNGFSTQNMYMRQQRRRQQHRDERENQSSSSAIINLLPICLLIGLSMMSSFFISDPIYNLTPSMKHTVRRETNGLKIPYYVKENFYSEYQGSVGRLENSVEEDFINHLKHTCSRERNYRDSMFAKARAFGDPDLYQRAQNANMQACANLQKYLNV